MSDLLTIGASGIKAYGRALQTTGDNVANANTAGYVRRDISLSEAGPSGDSVFYRNQVNPGGVTVDGVTRAADQWLTDDARAAGTDAAETGAKVPWLEAAERTFADGGSGVGPGMTAVFNRIDELTANPTDSTRRQAVLDALGDVTSSFQRTATGLDNASAGVASQAQTTVDGLNTNITALQKVNDGLRRARAGSTNQADLLDARDQLLDKINAALPMTVGYEATGAVTLTLNGQPVLAGSTSTTLTMSFTSGTLTVAGAAPGGGALAGLASAARQLSDNRSALDTLAVNYRDAMNAVQAGGRDLNGQPGQPLLSGTGAADLTVAPTSPDGIAAADATGPAGNALQFANLRGSTGGEARWAALVGQQSQSVANAQAQDAAATSRRDGANAARDAKSAVDLDTEAANLVRYQQAYDASARVLQVARDTMQSILSALG